MTIYAAAASPASELRVPTGGPEWRNELHCDLWMIDHDGSTVLRCHCLESSPTEMRLRVPLGYGVSVGQRYEVRSHLPGQRPTSGSGVIGTAWVTIVEARILLEEDYDHLHVRALRDPLESVLSQEPWLRGGLQPPAAA